MGSPHGLVAVRVGRGVKLHFAREGTPRFTLCDQNTPRASLATRQADDRICGVCAVAAAKIAGVIA